VAAHNSAISHTSSVRGTLRFTHHAGSIGVLRLEEGGAKAGQTILRDGFWVAFKQSMVPVKHDLRGRTICFESLVMFQQYL
jgi:hypothetical protein